MRGALAQQRRPTAHQDRSSRIRAAPVVKQRKRKREGDEGDLSKTGDELQPDPPLQTAGMRPPILPLPSQPVSSPAITGISPAMPKVLDEFSLGDTARSTNRDDTPRHLSLRPPDRVHAASKPSVPVSIPTLTTKSIPVRSKVGTPQSVPTNIGDSAIENANEAANDPAKMTLQEIIQAKRMGKPLPEDSIIAAAVRRHRKKKVASPDVAENQGDVGGSATGTNLNIESDMQAEIAAAPQLKIGADGTLQIDESSLSANVNSTAPDLGTYTRVNDDYRIINCKTYSKQTYSKPWSMRETDLFFEAMAYVGTDFTLMERLFQGRSRRQVKAKFVKEDKYNREKVDLALRGDYKAEDPLGRETILSIVAGSAPPPLL